ncbi:MAG: hypothetical protein ACP5J4_19925 [Anaerolineae bacterium]
MDPQLKAALRNIRLKGRFLRGLLGDFDDNVEVTGRPGYYYVRVEKPGGYEVGIFPGRVRALYNLPVRIETHPVTGVQFIAGADDETIAYGSTDPATIPALELHATTHGWGGDDMLMWLHTMQLFPLRCQPHDTTSTSVVIQAGTYYSEGVFCVLAAALTVDLSSYFSASGLKYVLVYLESSGNAGVQDDGATHLRDLSPAPAGTYWVAAVRLVAGESIGWQNIVDLRFMNSGVVNGGELELGTDYIVVGTGHPGIAGRWARLGTTLDTLLDTTRGTGLLANDDTDYVFLGIDRVASDEGRASLIWGDNSDDELWIAHYGMGSGTKTYVMRLTASGDLWILGTVDGVDVSAHDHSGGAEMGVAFPFLNLSDTPAVYTGMAGRVVTVKADETGLEFGTGGGSGGTVHPIHRWHIDGALAVADEVDGVWVVQDTFVPAYVWLYCRVAGTASSTIVDVEKSTDNGSTWTSLFASGGDYPELGYSAGHVATGAPDAIALYAGTLLRMNIDQVATGAEDLTVQLVPVDMQPAGGLLAIMGVG